MDIRITENLKAFRRENGNTQEQLAKHLNISVQAVSKWERGEGYPDIALLPSIAAYYNKSVDELLGCDEIKKAEKIDEYLCRYNENSKLGKIEANINLLKNALREFPNDFRLMFNLCHSLFYVQKPECLDECIRVGEKILANSVDDNIRFSTIQTLVYAYNSKKDEAKAKEYAEKLPGLYFTRDTVLECILRDEELCKLTQANIEQHIRAIDLSIIWLLSSREYTSEKKIFAYETVDKLYNLFFYDENYGANNSSLLTLWMNIAREYGKLQDKDKTIATLKKVFYHAYEMDHLKAGKYTSMFADTRDYSPESFTRNYEKSEMELLEEAMQESVFDFVRDTAEWEEIVMGVGAMDKKP